MGEALRASREAAANPESEPEPEPVDAAEVEPVALATVLRIHITEGDREMVNITIPLGVTRFIANIASFVPADVLEGVDLQGILSTLSEPTPGTLVDIYDNDDNTRVIITLE